MIFSYFSSNNQTRKDVLYSIYELFFLLLNSMGLIIPQPCFTNVIVSVHPGSSLSPTRVNVVKTMVKVNTSVLPSDAVIVIVLPLTAGGCPSRPVERTDLPGPLRLGLPYE